MNSPKRLKDEALDLMVKSGDIKSYEYVEDAAHLMPSDQYLILEMNSGRRVRIASRCGSQADSDSGLDIEVQ